MKTLTGKGVAITGAASGIGRATAVLLASQGCNLALSDVDLTGLEETRALCAIHPVKVVIARVDVADRGAMEAWAMEAERELALVHVIINNA